MKATKETYRRDFNYSTSAIEAESKEFNEDLEKEKRTCRAKQGKKPLILNV